MKTLRTAFILAVVMVVFKMCNNRDTFSFNSYSSDDTIQKVSDDEIYEDIKHQWQNEDKDIKQVKITKSSSFKEDNSTKKSIKNSFSSKEEIRFKILNKKELEKFFNKNRDSYSIKIYFNKLGNLIDATIYHLLSIKDFPATAQLTAFYVCNKFYDKDGLKLRVHQKIDNTIKYFKIDESFCNAPEKNFLLLSKMLDKQEFNIKILDYPLKYDRLKIKAVKKLYTKDYKINVDSWINKAVVNKDYLVYLDYNNHIRYYNRKNKNIYQLPDFQRDYVPTAMVLNGDTLYLVDNFLYAYNLKNNKYQISDKPLVAADKMRVVDDTIYLLSEDSEKGWYLFAYDKRLKFKYALFCNIDFNDISLQKDAIVARDEKEWYRFDIHSGKLLAKQKNKHLIISASKKYLINENGVIYDNNLTSIDILKPHMHTSEATFGKDIVFVKNSENLAIFNTKDFHRKAIIKNSDDFLTSDGKSFVTTNKKNLQYHIKFYNIKLNKIDSFSLTCDSSYNLAVSPLFTVFRVENKLFILDTKNLKVQKVLSFPSDIDDYKLKGSILYYKDNSDKWHHINLANIKISSPIKNQKSLNNYMLHKTNNGYLDIGNGKNIKHYWIGFFFDPKILATKHYGVIANAHSIYRIDFDNPNNVIQIEAIEPWDNIYDIKAVSDDTILVLSEQKLIKIDLAKLKIIKNLNKSDIVKSKIEAKF